MINTGFYVINPEILNYIPKDKSLDITQLIKAIKDDNKKVGVFPINEDAWTDVGEWTEYKKAVKIFS